MPVITMIILAAGYSVYRQHGQGLLKRCGCNDLTTVHHDDEAAEHRYQDEEDANDEHRNSYESPPGSTTF